ncbi:alpha-hydroxy acid oxidase [Chloroflexota bacterium]
MAEEALTISQTYARGKEFFEKLGQARQFSPDSDIGASVQANRTYLDSLFFETRLLDAREADTSLTLFGLKLKTPVFASPMGVSINKIASTAINDIARGVGNAGSLMMMGFGDSEELQGVIDTGAPVVKIVKPYQDTELIFKKVREAESRGCVAVGIDIDHSLGRRIGDRVDQQDVYAPQSTEILKQVISQTKLPFIIKGVLSLQDAEKAARAGASAIIVSNHGYNAFSFTIPSLIALPKIVGNVGDKLTVLVDTGFKTGNDVIKALALGARAVGFASSMLLAWGADGSHGVENLINQLTAELHRTMRATGCPDLSAINSSLINRMPPLWE